MRTFIKPITIFIIFLFIILTLYIPSTYAQEGQTKRVLVLNSYHKGFLWTDNIVKGIESVLGPEGNCVELKIEYMDSKATKYDTQYKEKLYDLYKYKYGNQTFDLIISSDDNAFNFLREYHEDLFPDTPIVFCGVNNLEAPDLIDHDEFTGIIELQSVKETIALALRLHPGTRQLLFIIDNTSTGVYFWSQIQEISKYYKDIRMTRIGKSLSLKQIEAEVNGLPDDTIVLFGPFSRDKSKYYSFTEAASRVSKASARPMYGHFVQVLPYGIVGGKLLGGFYHGQVAAKMAMRILMGEKVWDIPVLTEPQTRYMFNYEQLKRWGIKVSGLPEDSIVINKPYSFYEENKVLIWCIIVVIIFQMLIIISLIMNIVRRKKAEKELNISEGKFRKFAEYLPVAIAILDKNENTEYANRKYGETIGYTSEITNIEDWFLLAYPDEEYRKWVLEKWNADIEKALREGTEIEPSEYNVTCKDGKVRVMEISGAFVADKMIAIFNDITERKREEETLRENEEKLSSIFSAAENVSFIVADLEGNVLEFSPGAEKIFGYSKDEMMGKPVARLQIQEDVEKTPEMIETMKKGEKGFSGENVLIRKNGEYFPASFTTYPIVNKKNEVTAVLSVSIDITECRQTEDELAKHRDHLEELVQERTDELQKTINLMAGREVRMAELKEVMRKLRAQVETAGMTPVADDPLKEEKR